MGGNTDQCYDIATDSQGNVYWVGTVSGSAVDFGGTTVDTNGEIHAVIAKYDSIGNFQWVRSVFSQFYNTYAYGVDVDQWDHIYMTGYYQGTADFGSGISLSGSGSGRDMFLTRYDTTGNVIWAKKAGNSGSTEEGRDVVVDESGEFIYVTGNTTGQTATFDTIVLNSPYFGGAFIAKYDSAGSIQWVDRSVNTHSSGTVKTTGITYADDKVFLAGQVFFGKATFGNVIIDDGTPGVYLFTVCYDEMGAALWGRGFKGGDNEAKSIAADTLGNLFIAGRTDGAIWIDGDTLNAIPGDDDILIMKLDQSGNVGWANITGSVNRDLAWDVSVDNLGNAYFSGQFHQSTAFFGDTLVSPGSETVFVIKMRGNGALAWAQIGGNFGRNIGLAVHHDPLYPDHVFMGGYSWGPVTYGSSTIDDVGNGDAMVAMMRDTSSMAFATGSQVCPGVCDGIAYAFSNAPPPLSYSWSNGDTAQFLSGLCSGSYVVEVTDGSGTVHVDSVDVVSYNDPQYQVQQQGDSLWVNGGIGWQWWYNGTLLPNADSAWYKAVQNGDHHVVVEGPNGCTWSSDTVLVVLNVGMSDAQADPLFNLFPNPARDRLTIRLNSTPRAVWLTSTAGQEHAVPVDTESIDVRMLTPGLWTVTVVTDDWSSAQMFLKIP